MPQVKTRLLTHSLHWHDWKVFGARDVSCSKHIPHHWWCDLPILHEHKKGIRSTYGYVDVCKTSLDITETNYCLLFKWLRCAIQMTWLFNSGEWQTFMQWNAEKEIFTSKRIVSTCFTHSRTPPGCGFCNGYFPPTHCSSGLYSVTHRVLLANPARVIVAEPGKPSRVCVFAGDNLKDTGCPAECNLQLNTIAEGWSFAGYQGIQGSTGSNKADCKHSW